MTSSNYPNALPHYPNYRITVLSHYRITTLPSFSVFFSVFSLLPDWLGLSIWNLLNHTYWKYFHVLSTWQKVTI